MKLTSLVLTTALFSIFAPNCFAGSESPDVITSRIPAKIHVIQNFEDWNDVQIRFSGMLRNSCYSKEDTTVRVEGDQIYIDNLIRVVTDSACLSILTPYSGQIAVRDLKEGIYDVSVRDKFGTYQEMTSFKTE